jgi:hypothetical protein
MPLFQGIEAVLFQQPRPMHGLIALLPRWKKPKDTGKKMSPNGAN